MASKDPARLTVAKRQGALLRAARTRAGLTQEQLARTARLDRAQVIRHESGENGMTVRSQERYLAALRLPAGYFAEPPPPETGFLQEQVAELSESVARLVGLTQQLEERVARLEHPGQQRHA
jgi:transcriptional regulator with XRE-family HTH domain